MENSHQQSILIGQEAINRIELALEKAWMRETADPTETHNWSENNKALGQCAVTSVIIYDMFGGRMIYDKANFHIWNELSDGTQHDFTRKQFKEERIFSVYKYKTKSDVLFDERGKETQIEKRYNLLKLRFQEYYQLWS